jgi:hypothetical protein
MALQQTISISGQGSIFDGSMTIPIGDLSSTFDAYVKVLTVAGSKTDLTALILFLTDNLSFEKSFTFVPDLDGPNFIKQAYLHLKTLPEFADAVDC